FWVLPKDMDCRINPYPSGGGVQPDSQAPFRGDSPVVSQAAFSSHTCVEPGIPLRSDAIVGCSLHTFIGRQSDGPFTPLVTQHRTTLSWREACRHTQPCRSANIDERGGRP